jgi:hypothetical protein
MVELMKTRSRWSGVRMVLGTAILLGVELADRRPCQG